MDIKKARKEVGLTQEALAKRIGINRATLSKYENGVLPIPPSKLRKFALALKIPATSLWGLNEKYEDDLLNALSLVEAHDEGNLVLVNTTDVNETDADNIIMGQLVEAFYLLNIDGQKIAVERVKELSEIPKYKRTYGVAQNVESADMLSTGESQKLPLKESEESNENTDV